MCCLLPHSSRSLVFCPNSNSDNQIIKIVVSMYSMTIEQMNENTSSVLKKGIIKRIRHLEGYMDPSRYMDLAQDLLNWFDLKDLKI